MQLGKIKSFQGPKNSKMISEQIAKDLRNSYKIKAKPEEILFVMRKIFSGTAGVFSFLRNEYAYNVRSCGYGNTRFNLKRFGVFILKSFNEDYRI
jgi:hypothetical protein